MNEWEAMGDILKEQLYAQTGLVRRGEWSIEGGRRVD
jgi:hypothetical protein